MRKLKSLILVCALSALYGCAAALSSAAEPAPAEPAEKAPDALEWVASFCEGAYLPDECIRDALAAIDRHKESMRVPNEDLRFAAEQCRKERINRGPVPGVAARYAGALSPRHAE